MGTNNAITCVRCASATGAGTFDWLGLMCQDCQSAHDADVREAARQQAAQAEADRLALVATEVAERAVMWRLDL